MDRYGSLKKYSLSGGAVLLAGGGIGVWLLMPEPFGRLFDSVLHLSLAGLVIVLASLFAMSTGRRPVWVKAAGGVAGSAALAVVVLAAVMHIDYRIIPGTSYRHGLSAGEWKEDLEYLASEIPRVYPRFDSMVDSARFYEYVDSFEERIPSMSEEEIKGGLLELVAMVGDAHTFPDIYTHKLDWHTYPLETYLFDSGLYVLEAGRDYREVEGTYLVSIDSVPVEEVYERIRPLLSAESENNWKDRFTQVMTTAEFLHLTGVTTEPRKAVFEFRTLEGESFTRTMKAVHYMPVFYWSFMRKTGSDLSYIMPSDREDNYWFELRKETGTFYVQFNGCTTEDVDETLDEFIDRLDRAVGESDFERFVVDIRKNGGGNPAVSSKLADYIEGNSRIDRPGRLFALISRKTFSAAVEFASILENNSTVILVGEATGQGPVFCGNPQEVTLPNSGIEMLVARNPVFATLIDDGLRCIRPDIEIAYTVEDYLSGRDPAMQAVLEFEMPGPPATALGEGAAARLAGRYSFSPFQALIVSGDDSGLRMEVTDFLEESLSSVSTALYPSGGRLFETDMRKVTVEFPDEAGDRAERLVVHWRGIDREAKRAPEGERLPMELLAEGLYDEAAVAFKDKAAVCREAFPHLEYRLNRLGYEALRDGKVPEAVKIFTINTSLFPSSANVYDSLGEAYMRSGETELAISNYERSLELNPENGNAASVLSRLREE